MWHEIRAAAWAETWAIDEGYLQSMLQQSRDNEPTRKIKLPKVQGDVAILPMYGVINQRASIWDELFGGTSTQGLSNAFVRAVNNEKVGAIVFDVNSPGGTSPGVEELADLIWTGGQQKTVVAVANSMMASAAYWLGSQVGSRQLRLVASPGANVGSIGVYRVHEDMSKQLADEGIKITFIYAGKYKVEGNSTEPLSEDAFAFNKTQVEATYEQFVGAVARGRGVNKSAVREGMGQGRMMHAAQSAEMGLVDRVATFGRVLEELGGGTTAKLTRAQSQQVEEELCEAWESHDELHLIPLPHIENRAKELRLKMRLDK